MIYGMIINNWRIQKRENGTLMVIPNYLLYFLTSFGDIVLLLLDNTGGEREKKGSHLLCLILRLDSQLYIPYSGVDVTIVFVHVPPLEFINLTVVRGSLESDCVLSLCPSHAGIPNIYCHSLGYKPQSDLISSQQIAHTVSFLERFTKSLTQFLLPERPAGSGIQG